NQYSVTKTGTSYSWIAWESFQYKKTSTRYCLQTVQGQTSAASSTAYSPNRLLQMAAIIHPMWSGGRKPAKQKNSCSPIQANKEHFQWNSLEMKQKSYSKKYI